jgi:hypothetical protein
MHYKCRAHNAELFLHNKNIGTVCCAKNSLLIPEPKVSFTYNTLYSVFCGDFAQIDIALEARRDDFHTSFSREKLFVVVGREKFNGSPEHENSVEKCRKGPFKSLLVTVVAVKRDC